MIEPYKQLSNQYGSNIFFTRINTLYNPTLSESYRVLSTPTFILFENGRSIDRVAGEDIGQLKGLLLRHVQTQPEFWSLGINVNNIPDDVETMIVTVRGPFNQYNTKTVDVSTTDSANVLFSVPNSIIPIGYNYKVCIRGDGDTTDWCYTFNHGGNPPYRVTIDWPNLQSQSSSTSCAIIRNIVFLSSDFSNSNPDQSNQCANTAPTPDIIP